MLTHDTKVLLAQEADIVAARQAARLLAIEAGFAGSDLTLIATAVSEIARNTIAYAGQGEMLFGIADEGGRRGLWVVARDQGPGIADVALAMQDGYSTGNSLGLGLPGARRLMDEFEIDSAPGRGTTITMRKWAR